MSKLLITALCTPIKDDKVDYDSLNRLIDKQLDAKVDGLLCLGTTGEPNILTQKERNDVLEHTLSVCNGTPVWVGLGNTSTEEAIIFAKQCQDMGAYGLLVTPPSFSKCTATGYVAHVKQISANVDLPLILYNVPSRCGYTVDYSWVDKLQNKIVGVKDADKKLAYSKKVAKITNLYCGNDSLLPQQLLAGAYGAISVVSNFAPKVARSILDGEDNCLWEILCNVCAMELSPIVCKYVLYKMGIFDSASTRLPLTTVNRYSKLVVNNLLANLGQYVE